MTEEEARAIFLLAGITVSKVWRLENKYWPEVYTEERKNSPWWLLQTPLGMIEIGWRKRVISINWSACEIRYVVTEDDITKDDYLVHAASHGKAVQYMTSLRRQHDRLTEPVKAET